MCCFSVGGGLCGPSVDPQWHQNCLWIAWQRWSEYVFVYLGDLFGPFRAENRLLGGPEASEKVAEVHTDLSGPIFSQNDPISTYFRLKMTKILFLHHQKTPSGPPGHARTGGRLLCKYWRLAAVGVLAAGCCGRLAAGCYGRSSGRLLWKK